LYFFVDLLVTSHWIGLTVQSAMATMRVMHVLRLVAAGAIHTSPFGREGVNHLLPPSAKTTKKVGHLQYKGDNQHPLHVVGDRLMEVRPTCEQARDFCLTTLKHECGGIHKTTGGMWSVQRRHVANRRLLVSPDATIWISQWLTVDVTLISASQQRQLATHAHIKDVLEDARIASPDVVDGLEDWQAPDVLEDAPVHMGIKGKIGAPIRRAKLAKAAAESIRKSDTSAKSEGLGVVQSQLLRIECRQTHSKLMAWVEACGHSTKLFVRQYAGWGLLLLVLGEVARRRARGTLTALPAVLAVAVGFVMAATVLRMDGKPWWEQRWMEGPKF
jgi:hypothetical protein